MKYLLIFKKQKTKPDTCVPFDTGPLVSGLHSDCICLAVLSPKHMRGSPKHRNFLRRERLYRQYCGFSTKKKYFEYKLQFMCITDLKSEGVMHWEESFSKMRVTGRCSGWLGVSNMLWQWARRMETSPPSHIIWRFRSDLTIAWMWCASESWTSIESCEREK